jgi:hypothetical protein
MATDIPAQDRVASGAMIAQVLETQSAAMESRERIRFVYNEAVDDAANFLRDLVAYNPDCAACLLRAAQSLRESLPLP